MAKRGREDGLKNGVEEWPSNEPQTVEFKAGDRVHYVQREGVHRCALVTGIEGDRPEALRATLKTWSPNNPGAFGEARNVPLNLYEEPGTFHPLGEADEWEWRDGDGATIPQPEPEPETPTVPLENPTDGVITNPQAGDGELGFPGPIGSDFERPEGHTQPEPFADPRKGTPTHV